MNWKFDREADAAYLTVTEGLVARTIPVAPNVMIDLDSAGQVHGIEILGVSKVGLSPAVVGLAAD